MARATTANKAAKVAKSTSKSRRLVGSPPATPKMSREMEKAVSSKRLVEGSTSVPARKARPAQRSAAMVPTNVVRTARSNIKAATVTTTPKASKSGLKAQVETLERIVATLRAKNKESSKLAKAAAMRISEVEARLVELEERLVAASASALQLRGAEAIGIGSRVDDLDPGDALPPGVAVQEPARLDEGAVAALEKLEDHSGYE
jgi:hypothetical protein